MTEQNSADRAFYYGKYDAMDSYINYKLSGGDKYTGSGRKRVADLDVAC
ncbi:MAG: hypothetical protein LUG27_06740 [Clostridiales bacterium]|nr:hypothetical protein [Clostridiales bacterium]